MTGKEQSGTLGERVLVLVAETPGINGQVIAAKMGLTPHSISSTLNILTKKGKVIRSGDRGCGVRGGGYNGGYHYYPLGYDMAEAVRKQKEADRANNEVFETTRLFSLNYVVTQHLAAVRN